MRLSRNRRSGLTVLLAAILVGSLGLVAPSTSVAAPAGTMQAYPPNADFTATWTRADALKVNLDPTVTSPIIPADFPVMTERVWVWDTWPLTDLDTQPISYRGWHVIFSLVAPRNIDFQDRHFVAEIGYFYSRDGRSWTYGGPLFPAGYAFGVRQWAGSTVITEGNQVQAFYTASGNDVNPQPSPEDLLQRLAVATGRIHADDRGVWFTGFRNHAIIAEADGEWYQTYEQSEGAPIVYAFRDPWPFRNPDDGRTYILFEGNTAGRAGEYECTARDLGPLPPGHEVPAESNLYTGNIGLAVATSANLRNFQLLPPILSANCVNQQLERPHGVFRNGKFYLFTISHEFTYAPGLTGPDGVYGFVGDSVRSDYRPLNGSSLVLGNPAEQPFQQYSHYVMPNLLVESFIDRVPTPEGERSGGTLAPTLRLEIRDHNTYVVEELDYGYIPVTRNRAFRAEARPQS